jgi:hypothetical protein
MNLWTAWVLLWWPGHCDTVVVSQEFMTNEFTEPDVSGWSITGPLTLTTKLSYCAGIKLFGGY